MHICHSWTEPLSIPSSLNEAHRRDSWQLNSEKQVQDLERLNTTAMISCRPVFKVKLDITAVILCHNYTSVALQELSDVTATVVTVVAVVPFSLPFSSQRALL